MEYTLLIFLNMRMLIFSGRNCLSHELLQAAMSMAVAKTSPKAT